MIQSRRHITVLLLIGVMFASSLAQEPSTRTLSLKEAVTIALENNRNLSVARLEVERADARVQEAWGYALPSIDFNGTYTNALKKPVFFFPNFFGGNPDEIVPVEIGTTHSLSMVVSARQPLFDYTVLVGVGGARNYARAAREQFRVQEIQTITNVRQAYYTAVLASQVQNVMRANFENAEENQKNVDILSRQGLVSEYDQLRASVGVENLRPAVIEAENNYATSLDRLLVAMGVEYGESFAVQDTLLFEPVDGRVLRDAEQRILDSNISLKALRLQADVNRAFEQAERAQYLPFLSAFGNYQYQAAKNTLALTKDDLISSSQIGLTLSFNLFRGFQTNARVEQAQIEVRKTEEQIDNLETTLLTASRSVVLRLRQTQQRIEAQERTVEQASRGWEIANRRYLEGLGTQLEVKDALLALSQARLNKIQAVYDYLIAASDFDQIMGIVPPYVEATPEESD